MRRKGDDWETESRLEAIRRVANDPAVTVASLERELREKLVADWGTIEWPIPLEPGEEEDLWLRVTKQTDRSFRSLFDHIARGRSARGLNLKILIWFVENEPELATLANDILDQITTERLYPDVFALIRLFDDTAEGINVVDAVNGFHGRYVFYRPYYLDYTGRAMRCILTVGKDNPFHVALAHKYDAREFDRNTEEYERAGIIAPLPTSQRAVINLHLKSDDKKSPGNQMLAIDDVDWNGDRAQIIKGVALGLIGPSPASAWPFYARRLRDDECVKPGIIPMTSAEIKPMIREKFNLGFVAWKSMYIDPTNEGRADT